MGKIENWEKKPEADMGAIQHFWGNPKAEVNLAILVGRGERETAESVAEEHYTVIGQAGGYDFIVGEWIPSEELARSLAVNWMKNNPNPEHLREGGEP